MNIKLNSISGLTVDQQFPHPAAEFSGDLFRKGRFLGSTPAALEHQGCIGPGPLCLQSSLEVEMG
jgi:hypothetical protein